MDVFTPYQGAGGRLPRSNGTQIELEAETCSDWTDTGCERGYGCLYVWQEPELGDPVDVRIAFDDNDESVLVPQHPVFEGTFMALATFMVDRHRRYFRLWSSAETPVRWHFEPVET